MIKIAWELINKYNWFCRKLFYIYLKLTLMNKQPVEGRLFLRMIILLFFVPLLSRAQPTVPPSSPAVLPIVRQVKLSHFDMQSSAIVMTGGDSLSSVQYVCRNYWYPVTVPSTVLTGLVANKVYPDPYTGMNNMLIPDASDSFNHQYHLEQYSHLPNDPNPWKKPYWYRTIFAVPAADQGRQFALIFKGINYRAEVWVNGQRIADSSQMAGMFAEYSLNVSKAVKPGEDNALAVKIYPLPPAISARM
jgi:hypothetical protein